MTPAKRLLVTVSESDLDIIENDTVVAVFFSDEAALENIKAGDTITFTGHVFEPLESYLAQNYRGEPWALMSQVAFELSSAKLLE